MHAPLRCPHLVATGLICVMSLITPSAAAAVRLLGLSSDSAGSVLFDIDPITATASNFRAIPVSFLTGMAYHPEHGLFALRSTTFTQDFGALYRVEINTGAAALIGSTEGWQVTEGDLAFQPSTGRLFGLAAHRGGFAPLKFFEIDPGNGQATVGATIGQLYTNDFSAMLFPEDSYFVTVDSQTGTLLSVDVQNGAVLGAASVSLSVGEFGALAAQPGNATSCWLATGDRAWDSSMLYTMNIETAQMTLVSNSLPGNMTGLAVIPEPGTACLLLFGALGGGLRKFF